jgi:hypothetical protein
MKNLLVLLFSVWAGISSAQTDITAKVTEALKKGDAASLASMMMSQVDLSIDGKDDSYSKEQASEMIRKFFAEHPAKDFSVKHQGTSKLDDQYRIGDLVTSTGKYRVTFFLKKNGSVMQIRQISFEADDF